MRVGSYPSGIAYMVWLHGFTSSLPAGRPYLPDAQSSELSSRSVGASTVATLAGPVDGAPPAAAASPLPSLGFCSFFSLGSFAFLGSAGAAAATAPLPSGAGARRPIARPASAHHSSYSLTPIGKTTVQSHRLHRRTLARPRLCPPS
jgi:hypothetical protein